MTEIDRLRQQEALGTLYPYPNRAVPVERLRASYARMDTVRSVTPG